MGPYASPPERDIPDAQEPLKPLTRNRGQWLFLAATGRSPSPDAAMSQPQSLNAAASTAAPRRARRQNRSAPALSAAPLHVPRLPQKPKPFQKEAGPDPAKTVAPAQGPIEPQSSRRRLPEGNRLRHDATLPKPQGPLQRGRRHKAPALELANRISPPRPEGRRGDIQPTVHAGLTAVAPRAHHPEGRRSPSVAADPPVGDPPPRPKSHSPSSEEALQSGLPLPAGQPSHPKESRQPTDARNRHAFTCKVSLLNQSMARNKKRPLWRKKLCKTNHLLNIPQTIYPQCCAPSATPSAKRCAASTCCDRPA